MLVGYTLTQEDIKGPYQPTPSGSEAKSKMKGLYYQDVQEMLAERFHMDIHILKSLIAIKNSPWVKPSPSLTQARRSMRKSPVWLPKADNILYAYNGDRFVPLILPRSVVVIHRHPYGYL